MFYIQHKATAKRKGIKVMNLTFKEADKFILENNLGNKSAFEKYLAFKAYGVAAIESIRIFPAMFE